jgi:hypothetical protein
MSSQNSGMLNIVTHSAKPWLRQLIASVSQKAQVSPYGICGGQNKTETGYPTSSLVSSVNIIPPDLHTHISSGRWTADPLVATVQRQSPNQHKQHCNPFRLFNMNTKDGWINLHSNYLLKISDSFTNPDQNDHWKRELIPILSRHSCSRVAVLWETAFRQHLEPFSEKLFQALRVNITIIYKI